LAKRKRLAPAAQGDGIASFLIYSSLFSFVPLLLWGVQCVTVAPAGFAQPYIGGW
jgi:hypothetical protein